MANVISIHDMIAVMQSCANGNIIECRYRDTSMHDDWSVVTLPTWDWKTYEYRVKTECLKPEYPTYEIGKRYNCTFKESWVPHIGSPYVANDCVTMEYDSLGEGNVPRFRVHNSANTFSYYHATCFSKIELAPEIKYRAYKNGDEFMTHLKSMCSAGEKFPQAIMHPILDGLWVKNKYGDDVVQMTGYNETGIVVAKFYHTWENAFTSYSYMDGTPVGMQI